MAPKPTYAELQQRIKELELETARQKQEAMELRESEERFRELAELLPQTIYEMDAGGKLTFVSHQAYETFRYTKKEFENGLNGFEMIVPEDRDRAFENSKKVMMGEKIKPSEYTVIRKDQTTFPAIFLSSPILRKEKPVGLRGIIIDISDRKQAEDVLEREKEKFRVLVEESSLGIALIEKSGRYNYINPKFVEMFEYTLKDIPTGREWFLNAFPDPTYREQAISSWINDLKNTKSGQDQRRTFRVTCKGGSKKMIQFRPAILENGDQFVIYEDVSEQKRLEAQLLQAQKLEAIGTLTSGISHNFRNILTVVLMNCEIIKKKEFEDADLLTNVDSMIGYVKRGAKLVDELLEFSRQEPKKEFQFLNLSEILKEVYQIINDTFDKVIKIRLSTPESIPINGDYSELSHVFLNLCTNARDAMPKGGILDISSGIEGNQARVVISDTGEGMDTETMKKCFEPFFTTKAVDKGTGLGLSTAYGTVKKHCGEIKVYSKLDHGSAFELYFPLSSRAEAVKPAASDLAKSVRGRKILIVDDEIEICKAIEHLLIKAGYTVAVNDNGKAAIDTYKSWKPDLVLLDINMPEMSGKTCAEQIINHDPRARIVIISGYDISSLPEKHKNLIKGFISKPIEADALEAKLTEVLK
jgi:PAS domain S-box-containing protein